MNKTLIFTICARNYFGLTKILKKSLENNCQDFDFLVYLADPVAGDEEDHFDGSHLDASKVLSDYISHQKWHEMAFKYNLTEFCTAIKPFCFKHAIEVLGYEKIIYLDPDIFVYSNLQPLLDYLDDYKIILTPHIVFPVLSEGEATERAFLFSGVFNLGFLALAKSEAVILMLNWWGSRLIDQCYIDIKDGYFTDQKWIDFIPCFFPPSDLYIYRGLGANLAPWNFYEREIVIKNELAYVKRRVNSEYTTFGSPLCKSSNVVNDRLLFIHFSGFDYKMLCRNVVVQKNIASLKNYIDIDLIISKYAEEIKTNKDDFIRFLEKPYLYNYFSNGNKISLFHRRLYRRLINVGESFADPFSVIPGSFYHNLLQSCLIKDSEKLAINESVTKYNLPNLHLKLKAINFLMFLLLKVLGINRYIVFLRFFGSYSRFENQIHLYNSKYNDLM